MKKSSVNISPAGQEMDVVVEVPGSKYIANRLLIIGALAEGESVFRNVPVNDDMRHAVEALRALGINIETKAGTPGQQTISVEGSGGRITLPEKRSVYAGESGTLMRFITSFSSLAGEEITITGSERAGKRPMAPLISSLKELGVQCGSKGGFLPIRVKGPVKGGRTRLPGSISSQFASSLLLAAPYAEEDVEIAVDGDMVSSPYIDMTISLMREFGVEVEREGFEWFRVRAGQKYEGKQYSVPGDWSSASYFLAAAALAPGKIKVTGLDMNSGQGEARFPELLALMGCKVSKNDKSVEITGPEKLKGVKADMSRMPDTVQTLAVLAAFAEGDTHITGISHLQHKESDRITDTADELRKLDAEVNAGGDSMAITPGEPGPCAIDPHNDHRMAMGFAIAGARIPGVRIHDPGCVGKSFPGFWDRLRETGVKVDGP